MNNRRKQLMLASAKEYCKCVVEGKTLKYNQLLETTSFANIDSPSLLDTFNVVANHKYIFIQKYSRECLYPYEDRDFQVYFYGDNNNIETEYDINVRGNFIYEPNASDTCIMRIHTYSEFGTPLNLSIMLIDLTALGLFVDNVSDFFETDLGKYIAKGNYLSYETEGKFIHAQSPINFEGVNIWDEKYTEGYYNIDNGTLVAISGQLCTANLIKVKPNTIYYVYCGSASLYNRALFYDKDKNYIGNARYQSNGIENIVTPNNCFYMNISFGTLYGTAYNNDICINEYNENYNGKYYKYCGNSVFESGLTLYKGDKYKTYGIDEISYNNLIPNANQNYVNSNTDSANANVVVYGANGGVYWAENLESSGFYSGTFESNTTEFVNIYMSGNNTNLYFATDIQMTSGHKYYISFNVLQNDVSIVGGLRIANLRLIDLTELGLSALTDKLRIFLQKNYKLPFTLVNKTIKDQIVRTFKEVDLSTLTWTYNTYINAWQSDLSSLFVKSYATNVLPSANAEKYRTIKYNDFSSAVEGDMWLFSIKPILEIKSSDSVNAPSGKALLELETPEINVWYHLEIIDYHEFEQYSGGVYKLDRDLSDLNVYDITADIGENQGGLLFLIVRGNYNDYCYENGYIYVKSDDIENAWEFDLLINNLPTRMVSRRTINVESENEIDLDFTKE